MSVSLVLFYFKKASYGHLLLDFYLKVPHRNDFHHEFPNSTCSFSQCRVLAQVSCEVTEPKQTRPTEGIVFVNVELSPMAAPQFEAGR